MAIAVVTGASRGLGRALAEELASRGWSLVVDGRDGAALDEAAAAVRARLAPGASVVALSGDVADAAHRRELVDAALDLGGVDLLVNNASTLGATPLPALGDYPLDGPATGRRGQRGGARSPSCKQALAALLGRSPQPGRAQHHVRRVGRGTTKGGAATALTKAALDHLTVVLAAEEPALARLGRRPRRHAHRRCTRTPSRARTSPTAPCPTRSCPTWCAWSRRDRRAGVTAWPTCGPRRSRPGSERSCTTLAPAVSRALPGLPTFVLPPELEAAIAARGPRHDPGRGAHARGPHGHDGTLVHSHFSELPRFLDEGDLVVVNTSGTLAAAVPGMDRSGGGSRCTCPRTCPPSCGRWSCASGTGPWFGADAGEVVALDGGGRIELLAPVRHASPGRATVGGHGDDAGAAAHLPGRARPAHPLRVRAGQLADLRLPERLRHRAGLGRDAERGPSLHPRDPHPAGGPGRRRGPRRAPHRRGLARGIRAALPRVLPGQRATARRVNDTRREGGRVVAIGTTVVRPSRRWWTPGSRSTPAADGPTPSSRPSTR